ncbi:MAG: VWA domain-containing protein [Acidimicrobiia bacterium]|nr:VWA domain-containing protein [Acidimicrobiia bacterium]
MSVERHVAGFLRTLRHGGLDVPVGSSVLFMRALDEVGLGDRASVYWAARATLIHRPEDLELFERLFNAWWQRDRLALRDRSAELDHLTLAIDDADALPDTGEEVEDSGPTVSVRYSAAEILRHKDFAECSEEELEAMYRLLAALRVAGPFRRSRRLRPTAHATGRLDLRHTVQAALRAGGEPIELVMRRPGTRPRRLVLLIDVSGSMEAYARALLRFVHAAVAGRGRVEAFALGTRLTRLTRELSSRDPDAALARAAEAVPDWSGGTRLGEVIGAFNDQWGVRGMARGAVVVVLSDGWDRGDPAIMATEMGRLHRVAHRVVWVNPLKASAGYAPLARGMAAALPYVDEFVEGHNLDSLDTLAGIIEK